MIKFFRKHNKKLLAVFMVLLMVVFLGGSALDTLMRPQVDRVIGSSRWGEISQFDQLLADETTQILTSLGVNWQQMLGSLEPLETLDWILLVQESRHLGTASDTERIRSTLVDDFGVEQTARLLRKKPTRILEAMADYNSILETATLIGDASLPSEADIQVAARNVLETVKINAVMLPASAFVAEDDEYTEDELAIQFDAYRERKPGAGLEFGYYVEPKLKVEYLKIDRDRLAESVRVVNLERKAREYFDERRERDPSFRRPLDAPKEVVEGPEPEKPSPFFTWDEAREIAENAVRTKEATEKASQVADWLVRYMNEPWLDQDRGEDGYRSVPEVVTKPDYYAAVLGRFPKSLSFPDAVSSNITDFFDLAEAADVPDIGSGYFVSQQVGRFERLGDLAFRTRAIVPNIPKERGINYSDYLAPFQTSNRPLRDSKGNVYLFRVVDARSGHIPDEMDEVRDRVVEDLRLKNAYEAALARAESLRSCEEFGSLEEAYESDEELLAMRDSESGRGSGYFEVPPIARVSRFQAEAGMIGPTTSVGVAEIRSLPTEIVEECFELEYYDDRKRIFELPNRAAVLVAEWVETQTAGAGEFAGMREDFGQRLANTRIRGEISDWLKPEKIRARNQFALATN